MHSKVQPNFIDIVTISCARPKPPTGQKNPRRKCSVNGCTRKTELYCQDCSKIDGNGHRLFYVCGAGQRVTIDGRDQVGGVRNKMKGTAKVTNPYCYKYHLDHLDDLVHVKDDGDDDGDEDDDE